MSLKTAAHGDTVRVLSSVFIIGQKITRNREYLISWLLKLPFELGTFSEFLKAFTFWKDLICLFYKSLLPFLTFVNYKGPSRETSSQHLSMFRYCVCLIRSHPKSKE